MQILVGLIEHLGDIVACEPVARYLKTNHPEAHLSWVVLDRFRELVDSNPHVDQTIVVECLTEWMLLTHHSKYDKIVDLHVNYRVCEHCRIPLVKKTGNPFVSAYEWFDYGALLEAFSQGAGLPKLSAQPQVYLGPEHAAAVDALGLPEAYCVIHRESNNTVKDWSDEAWLETAAFIRDELGLAIVEVGAGRRTRPSPLQGETIDLFNRLPILQTAEVIRRSRFFLGIDSGPAHLANATSTPGVILLGRHGHFRQYNPYTGFYAGKSPKVRIVRNLNGNVSDIDPAEVVDAIRYVTTACTLNETARREKKAKRTPPPSQISPEDRLLIRDSGLFDAGWYALQHPGIEAAVTDPLTHYLSHGAPAGASPGPEFDPERYLRDNPDVADAGMNPLLHYLRFGRAEGRQWARPPALKAPDSRIAQLEAKERAPLLPETEYPRTFAFYLPQFHPIEENDWAHQRGFVEWHNVVKTEPLFPGHHQPRVPGELGFYDLRAKEVIEKQIGLAKEHGISGFCFYYYYFKGKKLLFDPIKQFLESDIDFPFFFLWANENWSKRWDGGDKEVIIAQEHSPEDDIIFLRELEPIFADPRYVKVNGKPILMVYKAQLFDNVLATVEAWRQEARKMGYPDLYLVMVDDWGGLEHPRYHGFDASYEIPSNLVPEQVYHSQPEDLGLVDGFEGRIVDYAKFAGYHMARPFPAHRRFRTVMLPWDNTPRYGRRAMVQINTGGDHYRSWLLNALLDTFRRYEPEERIVFLHSWNEWCEGTYLEPDAQNGRRFLEETRDAIRTARAAIDWSNDPVMVTPLAEIIDAAAAQDRAKFYALEGLRQQNGWMWQDLQHQRDVGAGLSQDVERLRRLTAELAEDVARERQQGAALTEEARLAQAQLAAAAAERQALIAERESLRAALGQRLGVRLRRAARRILRGPAKASPP